MTYFAIHDELTGKVFNYYRDEETAYDAFATCQKNLGYCYKLRVSRVEKDVSEERLHRLEQILNAYNYADRLTCGERDVKQRLTDEVCFIKRELAKNK